MLFDIYLFADYSGALGRSGQRKAIRLAEATRTAPPFITEKRLTRADLVSHMADRLKNATRRGERVCFGQDHQYAIPLGLARELSVEHLAWRDALQQLASGAYGVGAPPMAHPKAFASRFNDWLVARGGRAYFYSATKASLYGVPARNPRERDRSTYRITELRRPASRTGSAKAFNRVGDNGTVGGQSLVGMLAIKDLLERCARDGVRVAAWPFDGLSIDGAAYADAHVLIEPYPTAVRHSRVAQTDESDALASAAQVRDADANDTLRPLLDLSALTAEDAAAARAEGWILSHRPEILR